ncbi:hypothetical protein GOV11_00470 [Candidatus Woesearchaeota archaeon]|nr:hypothetical protein [Candidatus Woesearchaeota archaeon]
MMAKNSAILFTGLIICLVLASTFATAAEDTGLFARIRALLGFQGEKAPGGGVVTPPGDTPVSPSHPLRYDPCKTVICKAEPGTVIREGEFICPFDVEKCDGMYYGCRELSCLGCVGEDCAKKYCIFEERTYRSGESFPAPDGCNTCYCGVDGTVGCTEKACVNDAYCEWGGEKYKLGSTRDSDDGCNTCSCRESGYWACTQRACVDLECKQNSDCPEINCITEPCNQYLCRNGECVMDFKCGNGVCDAGEETDCPICDPGTLCSLRPCVLGTCPQDCADTVCIDLWKPVCGMPPEQVCPPGAQCRFMEPVPTTYSNRCFLDGANAEFLYEGECKDKPACTWNGRDYYVDDSWESDNCGNSCTCLENGQVMCTMMPCATEQTY